jgi:hypothetical protein
VDGWTDGGEKGKKGGKRDLGKMKGWGLFMRLGILAFGKVRRFCINRENKIGSKDHIVFETLTISTCLARFHLTRVKGAAGLSPGGE